MGEVLRAIFELDGVTRGPGFQGQLKRFVSLSSDFNC
jgi:ribosomal protein L3